MSTRFEDLTRRIRALPERHRRVGQIGKLKRYAAEVRKVGEDVRGILDTRRALGDAFPAANLDRVDAAAEQAERLAARLRSLLSTDADAVDTPQADDLVIKLKGQAQAARSSVREEWRGHLQHVLQRYQKLIGAANKFRLKGAQPLVATMARIQGYASVDPTAKHVEGLRDELNSLLESIRTSKIEGKGGRFLEQVLDHQGDPRALLDPEVRAFLDSQNLWGDIVVVLR